MQVWEHVGCAGEEHVWCAGVGVGCAVQVWEHIGCAGVGACRVCR